MINIFRKVRQKLLRVNQTSNYNLENKFRKYVIYGIGEIVLVVIGILIALQINNWHNNKQLEKLEYKYLNEIKNSLISDLPDIQFNIDFNEDKLTSNEMVLQYLNQEKGYSDSLKFHLSNLIFTTRTIPNVSAFENLKSRGLEIISNDCLRQEITALYSFYYYNVIDFEKQDDHPFQYNLFMPEVSKVLNIVGVCESAEPINEGDLFKNYHFKNVITTNVFLRKYMIQKYQQLKKELNNVLIG